jgi:hypothetical protein
LFFALLIRSEFKSQSEPVPELPIVNASPFVRQGSVDIRKTVLKTYTRDRFTMSIDSKRPPKKNFDPAQWVSQAKAAEIRGVSRQAIAGLLKKGRFTTLSIGGKILLKRSEVEEFKPKPPGPSPKKKALAKPRKRLR